MTERKIAGGKLIVIEGTDGSGKHTQSEKLFQYLQSNGWNVKLGGFPMYKKNIAGKIVGQMLKGDLGDFDSIDPLLAAMPFALDRAEAQPMLKEHLNNGGVWVLDRYVISNWAHGASKYGNDDDAWEYVKVVRNLEFNGIGIAQPDLNVFLRVPVEVSRRLMEQRAEDEGRVLDEAEKNLDYQRRTLSFYDQLAEDPANKIVVINCEDEDGGILSIENIHQRVVESISLRLPELIEP